MWNRSLPPRLLSRRVPGGSLKVVAAKAARNLRRYNVRLLFIDEADGMEATAEGSPIVLAERRTLSFPDRKIVLGSTPVHEDTSHVLRAYAQSDQRIFEVPCPECGTFSEITWDAITWDEGAPESAGWRCPHCAAEIEERHKPGMVEDGRWRALRPEVQGHAGFRMNALVSLHANASWAKLAAEFIGAKDDPTTLQTFVNTILGPFTLPPTRRQHELTESHLHSGGAGRGSLNRCAQTRVAVIVGRGKCCGFIPMDRIANRDCTGGDLR